ncbi:MAG TPA: DUF2848 family protein [Pseudonocardia sp.]|jgi:4-hydroxyphenylacetate 3-monooxygenase|nr:DUF2848 family protein [Pseudonocardia sp.]
MTRTDIALGFEIVGTGETFSLDGHQTVVAGYTGRDEQAVRHHIEELAAIGVPQPPTVPMFYPMDSAAVSTAPWIEVAGSNTSGEAEPVLVRHRGNWYLGVGSDHTDRDLETRDIAESKQACPKPVSTQVVGVPDWEGLDWDAIRMASRVDGKAYQEGALSGLRRPENLLTLMVERGVDEGRDLVCFAGTLPLIDGKFVAGTVWELTLTLPDGRDISHTYEARRI